ncbi:DUF262 domain-containing protein [uncultured Thiohalocapsa sp.]|uniref:DUF262 domain-containing protein n=1 Tax=uncultured Thiohalocapsa sp. TaxID=768990 RepID=UPI0025CC2942|nr:DUF262 domain-containing protein [uncultured Thiohalocapsa sp.]
MTLQSEIDKARADIRTDGYPISIGEWISIYEQRELDIHPEFQRFFRWTQKQKSRLIESLLLGIPIPQIFVSQRDDGVWDVVDGLQRLSTIFEFIGILRDEEDRVIPALTMEATAYLPSLAGIRWQDDEEPGQSLSNAQRLLIKRAKIDVSIILKESDEQTKFELFQRLNTGGSPLSDQEMRNSLLVMLNRDLFRWMKDLSGDASFRECIALSDRAVDEQYDMELVLRFLALRTIPEEELTGLGDLGEFLTEKAKEVAKDGAYDRAEAAEAFRSTFRLLADTLGSDSFHRFDQAKGRFLGGFSISAFEAIALGIGYNYKSIPAARDKIAERARNLWTDPRFLEYSGAGMRASTRIPRIVPLGRTIFSA